MNLHVTNDEFGFYPVEIANRIEKSAYAENNLMVNLFLEPKLKHQFIRYITISSSSFENFVKELPEVDKIIFHPFNTVSYRFLKIFRKKFPNAKVYWVCWSYELYNTPQNIHALYDAFSTGYVAKNVHWKIRMKRLARKILTGASIVFLGGKSAAALQQESFQFIDFFCSLLPGDYAFFKSMSSNQQTKYLPFAYLSLNTIMPDLHAYNSVGNKIMVGHSASPDGNHFEIIERVSNINPALPVFLPLAYGNTAYAAVIKEIALQKLSNVEVLENKMDISAYYKKLTEVGWVIINVKVQQGLGNILALIWMGAKVFLSDRSSTYNDFKTWGIKVYSLERELNEKELTHKLLPEEVVNNRKIIFDHCSEEKVSGYWQNILA